MLFVYNNKNNFQILKRIWETELKNEDDDGITWEVHGDYENVKIVLRMWGIWLVILKERLVESTEKVHVERSS